MVEERRVVILSPAKYSQEEIAVGFAKYSRDDRSIVDIMPEITEKSAAQFHEKWVIGYSHSSVAEHAVLHVALENVSRLAVETVQRGRLASYTEKSTRYQKIDRSQCYEPQRVMASKYSGDFGHSLDQLFVAYQLSLREVKRYVADRYPRKQNEDDIKYDARIRTKYIDICKYVLPKAVLANLGWTANARVMETACVRMLSDRLEEVREIGAEVKSAVLKQTPTLVKYADQNSYRIQTRASMDEAVGNIWENYGGVIKPDEFRIVPRVDLVNHDPMGEAKFLAAWLYELGSGQSFRECIEVVGLMSEEQKQELIKTALGKLEKYDKAGRELELPLLTFDLLVEQGTFYDFKRNRPMTQIVQRTSGALGVMLPGALYEVGVGGAVEQAIRESRDLARLMKPEFEGEDEYLYTNAEAMRMLMSMNLREMVEFWRTRSSPQANPGYRYTALVMGEVAAVTYPNLWKYLIRTAKAETPRSKDVGEDFYGSTS